MGAGVIGETGTGAGVGLAWMAAGAAPDARIVSVERDTERSGAVAALFADDPRVTVLHGDAADIRDHGLFDLLVLDGGPLAGKMGQPP